ncbi:SIMPL domain-containing protein [Parasphingopyxis marina]|uniref:SIMPL domain-containing protein n=1 Tax=Parasphingopyxis marina TaxID=2761622 RepID=A0A842HX57_9SPHN|nr:SIMPL domain-containing protein [Parasphingopyxis marina]MBC2778728.1 SIMPL domain-containing protein [Parasphingopyxis marina]
MKTALLALAASCALAAPAAAQTADIPLAIEGTRLDIVATGESRQVPDLAIVNAGVVTEAPTAAAAFAENNRRMAAVFSALRRAGIEERDIQTASINLNARYDYSDRSEPQLLGYTASNQLSVRFRDVERAGTIIDTLVGQGVNQINGPSLEVDEPEAALDEARRDAISRARARAELYAQAAGMRVERIVAISETGAARPPMPMANRAMAMAESDTALQIAPGEQRLSATLSVTFELR